MTPADWSNFALATPQQAKPAPPAGSASGWDQFALATSPQGQSQKSAAEAATLAKSVAPVSQPDAGKPSQAEGGGFWGDLIAPAQSAWQSLQADTKRYAQAADPRRPATASYLVPGMSEAQQAQLAQLGDVGALVASPIAGLINAAVVQPGAKVLDQLPAPQQVAFDANGRLKATTMTPAQQHAQNESIISSALMAVGPEGMEGGAAAKYASSRYASKVASIVSKVPPEVALDGAGELTAEGQEAAARAGVHPEDVKTGYQAVQQAQAAEAAPAAAPEEAPAAQPAPEAQPTPPAAEAAPPAAAPEQPAPAAAPQPEPAAATPPPADIAAPEAGLSQGAAERAAQAQSEGVQLSKGQATQDFATQEREQTLQGMNSAEGNTARQFFANQQQQIASAVDRFKQAFGDPEATAADRGQMVKDALTQLRDSGKAGVTALYTQARQLAEGLGDNSSNLIRLDTQPLLEGMRELWSDEGIPDQVRNSLKQQAARYGLIGESPKTIEGETTVTLRDSEGNPAGKQTFTGQQEPLTVVNAEGLRQKLNALYDQYRTPEVLQLKPVLDDAVQGAIERAASEGQGDIGQAFKDARAAHQVQQQTFAAKDVVQKLIDWKVRGVTPTVLPENAIKAIFAGGKDSITQLKKVKTVLLNKPTPQSQAAWQAIQAHAVADIFDQAMTINANSGSGSLGAISGAKLNTAIAKFGPEKLKVLLSEGDYNQLMKLRRIIGDATIPIKNTTNPSGSGYAVIRFLTHQGMKLGGAAVRGIPLIGHGISHGVDVVSGLAKMGQEAAEAKRTLEGIENFTPEAAAKADAPAKPKVDPVDYARRFIQVAKSDKVLGSIIASAANDRGDEQKRGTGS